MNKKANLHEDEHYYKIIRENIRYFRLKNNLTQQQLADMIDMSREYICDIENENRNKHLTIAVLGRIADAMNVDIAKLFVEKQTNPLTKEDIEALGYACGEIKKCFENGYNKSLKNKPLSEEEKEIKKIEHGSDFGGRYLKDPKDGKTIYITRNVEIVLEKLEELTDIVNEVVSNE